MDSFACEWCYFVSFGVEIISKDIKKLIRNKNMITNNYKIQAYDSIMYGYFCIGFIDFLLKRKGWLDYTSLLSPNDYGKKDKILLKYFE